MTIDQRARTAADDVRQQMSIAEVPDAGVIARQARRRRRRRLGAGAAVVAMTALAVGLVAVRDEPASPPAATDARGAEGWERILKSDAGIDPGAELASVGSDGENALVAGAAPDGDWWRTGIWFSEDGRTWVEADHPDLPGHVSAVAFHDGVALASGVAGVRDASYQSAFVWRSDDGGRTWQDLAVAPDAFGPPAPEMGRPFVSQLVFRDGWWVAAGGSSTGYSGIWLSETGDTWEQVLESREGGGPSLADLAEGGLLAYWTTVGWSTDDPTEWGPHFDVDAPGDLYPASIAAGADLAAGQGLVSHRDTALLRSADEGHSWHVDDAFDRRFPDAFLMGTARFGEVDVVAGADGDDRPTAWLSVDGGPWGSMPEALREPTGGTLGLITEVDGRIVLFGTAPELDRFYVATP